MKESEIIEIEEFMEESQAASRTGSNRSTMKGLKQNRRSSLDSDQTKDLRYHTDSGHLRQDSEDINPYLVNQDLAYNTIDDLDDDDSDEN